jgi:hypothetical protein
MVVPPTSHRVEELLQETRALEEIANPHQLWKLLSVAASHKHPALAFSMAVKDNLFPKHKFLQGTNASLFFSMDTTSICGFLHICCGVAENDGYQWWEEHRILLKNIHTDCHNNKIKTIKQQFNGEFMIYPVSMYYMSNQGT